MRDMAMDEHVIPVTAQSTLTLCSDECTALGFPVSIF
jgi:hypothetical protein